MASVPGEFHCNTVIGKQERLKKEKERIKKDQERIKKEEEDNVKVVEAVDRATALANQFLQVLAEVDSLGDRDSADYIRGWFHAASAGGGSESSPDGTPPHSPGHGHGAIGDGGGLAATCVRVSPTTAVIEFVVPQQGGPLSLTFEHNGQQFALEALVFPPPPSFKETNTQELPVAPQPRVSLGSSWRSNCGGCKAPKEDYPYELDHSMCQHMWTLVGKMKDLCNDWATASFRQKVDAGAIDPAKYLDLEGMQKHYEKKAKELEDQKKDGRRRTRRSNTGASSASTTKRTRTGRKPRATSSVSSDPSINSEDLDEPYSSDEYDEVISETEVDDLKKSVGNGAPVDNDDDDCFIGSFASSSHPPRRDKATASNKASKVTHDNNTPVATTEAGQPLITNMGPPPAVAAAAATSSSTSTPTITNKQLPPPPLPPSKPIAMDVDRTTLLGGHTASKMTSIVAAAKPPAKAAATTITNDKPSSSSAASSSSSGAVSFSSLAHQRIDPAIRDRLAGTPSNATQLKAPARPSTKNSSGVWNVPGHGGGAAKSAVPTDAQYQAHNQQVLNALPKAVSPKAAPTPKETDSFFAKHFPPRRQ